jgi:5'-nucleotidase
VALEKPWILLTNDDGIDSPILVPLIRELSALAEVRTVVPASECSWTAKIMSRFNPVTLTEVERGGFHIKTLGGYPADCANIGIHSLFPTRPTLIVSGVNMGTNAGLAFFFSSGTVGAAVEGVLAGLPAVASSLELPKEDYTLWRRERRIGPQLEVLLGNAAVVTREIVEEVLRGGLPVGASMLTVNMPTSTTADSPRRFTGVARTAYGSIFDRNEHEDRFDYSFSGLQLLDEGPRGDVVALREQVVSITPVRFVLDVEPGAKDRQRFERAPLRG